MTTFKSIKKRAIIFIMVVAITSCGENNKNTTQEEKKMFYIINHQDDAGKYGEGTYINTNTEYTCPHCGMRVSRDNIFHDCQHTKFSGSSRSSSGHNQYGEGYEQGQEDARMGLDPNPEGYGGNGQFEKGYEDGYEDW